MDQSTYCVGLRVQILALERKNAQGQPYITTQGVFSLITFESVLAELKRANFEPYQLKEIASKIVSIARIFFAILVLIEKVKLAERIIGRAKLRDRHLPLGSWELGELDPGNIVTANNFWCTQWQFLPPSFSPSTISMNFSSEIVLPFLKDEEMPNSEGAFGTMYKIEIDGELQEFGDGFSKQLVRKELSNDVDHSVELNNLAVFTYLKHPNIIKLLASYRYHEKNNLIFPLADGGSLRDLFDTERPSTPFQSDETLLVAMAQLSSALEHVHEVVDPKVDLHLIGYHHDLRPRNILVSEDTLLLADFGISQFKRASEDSKTDFKMGKDHYLAPECEKLDDEFKKSKIGRSSDIWSFGCIIMEVLVYMTWGPQGVKKFREKRRFQIQNYRFHHFHCGSKPNPAVEKYLSELSNMASNSRKFLISLIKTMLSLSEKDRPKIRTVTTNLRLAAISEVSTSIETSFRSFHETQNSMDASIEFWRFEAWEYGLGISNIDSTSSEATAHGGVQGFHDALTYLHDMKRCLEPISESSDCSPSVQCRTLAQRNDWLTSLLDKKQQARARTRFSSTFLDSRVSENLREKQDELTSFALNREIRMLAALKTMSELTAMQTASHQLDIAYVGRLCSFGKHDLTTFANRSREDPLEHPVLVEWRKYGRNQGDVSVSQELFVRLDELVGLLKMEKPKEFCSLPCLGFYHDPTRCAFGVVYELPKILALNHLGSFLTSTQNYEPITLQRLLHDYSGDIGKQPLLEHKFNLAQIIAQAVLEFHLVGWLHKDLNSANIILPKNKGSIDEIVQDPRIIGFNHSRPNDPSVFTSGTPDSDNSHYQHPTYQRDGFGFKQEYDYYSLGIVLLEIGLWTPIKVWLESDSWKNLSAERIKQKILKSRLQFLGQCMGSTYREAVKACLEGEILMDTSDLVSNNRKQALCLAFQEFVLSRIGKKVN